MIEVSKLLLLVLGELLLVGIVVSAIVVFQAVSRRQRERSAVRKLVSRIKEDSGRREAETRKIMQERFGFDGSNLEQIVKRIARDEKVFYQVLIDVYLHHKTDAVQNLCVDYESSLETYRTLELSPQSNASDPSEETIERSEAYRLLRDENERLTEELKKTMDTMASMLSEYSMMFSGGTGMEIDRNKLGEILAERQETESQDGLSATQHIGNDVALDPDKKTAGISSEEAGEPVEIEELQVAVADDSIPEETVEEASGDAPSDMESVDDLKTLDDELEMLDLSDDGLPAGTGRPESDVQLDETVAFRLEESDEMVDLEDVLEEGEPTDEEKK